jgi:uncharacterized protein (DUF1330 family)
MGLENNVFNLDAINDLPENTPIYMLNLVKYNDEAKYPAGSTEKPCSGKEAYFTRYIPAFRKIVAEVGGAETFYAGDQTAHVIKTKDEDWDVVALIKYPDVNVFRAMIKSDEYDKQARPHRDAAVKDWKLIGSVAMNIKATQ